MILYFEKKFLKNINKLIDIHKNKLLICVSGGVDSMVLLNILFKYKFKIGVCHINFNLRKNSIEEKHFIKSFCKKRLIPFYYKITNKIKKKVKESIQIDARNIRYIFFYNILKKKKYDFILLGHNLDDSIETFFINLFRGTGIKGLIGIQNKIKKKIVRPLLIFNKKEIKNYAYLSKIKYIEDKSNKKNKFFRNKIRNNLIPFIKNDIINNNFYKIFKKTISYLNEENIIIKNYVNNIFKKVILKKKEYPFYLKLNCSLIKKLIPLNFYLHYFFFPYGFNNIKNLKEILITKSGKKLYSSKYELLKNRNSLIIIKRYKFINKTFKIYNKKNKKNFFIKKPIFMFFLISKKKCIFSDAFLDMKKIKFPLYIRKWKHGDLFYPIGMNEKKKNKQIF
ncbi:tRNA lysidine(34) synthetase TilS [Candidatus Shikimatogenerans silvanidophilus]|uniref:tRNA lysidine(34) synthetase TilS n=1 Tax=Candidatus Shikimatogenerans silvanidophilus TaxID=2782547 RepID=UPI001BA6F746|nr:tRNA lysidine(34) synthetase TilS [Candidatus Shikimatogenerans silvanidophilus]